MTGPRADTSPQADDARLRGRTYAIPFERVWSAILALCSELPRWTVLRADDQEGFIDAEARSLVLRAVDDVRIEVSLDENGQTRVDVSSRSRSERTDLGRNARRVAKVLKLLDRRLEAGPGDILGS